MYNKGEMITLLFIDDDKPTQNTFKMILPDNYSVISAYSSNEGLEKLKEEDIDVILLDMDLPDRDGIETLKKIKSQPQHPPVIMLSVFTHSNLIVKAIKAGAYDYITKPYNLRELTGTIQRAAENHLSKKAGNWHLSNNSKSLEKILGISKSIESVKRTIAKYAQTDATVLITGESGVGKELAARAIHELSPRAKGPFIPINCANLSPNLIDSELFGSEKGAFTDAISKPGLLEQANGGTVFLDEIGELGASQQAALLRVLEEKRIRPVGSRNFRYVNIRIITATNRKLKDMVKEKNFREDLFFRISVLPIGIPPLRERKTDIPILANYFLKLADKTKELTEEATETLIHYPWPGNIRELKNVMERTALLSEGSRIGATDIKFL